MAKVTKILQTEMFFCIFFGWEPYFILESTREFGNQIQLVLSTILSVN
jgi:hypothetical protein